MSGRIRTIKPELLEDTKTARLSHLQFRLFVSLILLADDYGNLRASVGLVRGNAFWGNPDTTEADLESALSELEDLGLIETYSMRGQVYAHIKNWSKHQRVDKPGKPRVPSPKDPEVRPARPWVTYFIRLGKDGPIKIGRTFDVAARVRKLQTGAPEKLEVLRVLDGDFESALHERFSSARGHGEWFSPTEELLKTIAEEPFANHSRIDPVSLAPDLRSPTPITDQGPPTRDRSRPAQVDDGDRSGFAIGTASAIEAKAEYESAVAEATGAKFGLPRAPFHMADLCDVLNTFATGDSKADKLAWLRTTVAEWVNAADGKSTAGWQPSKLQNWLNGNRPSSRQPIAGRGAEITKQPFDPNAPWMKVGS